MTIRRTTLASYLLFALCNLLYFYFFVFTHPMRSLSPGEFHFDYYSMFYFPVNYDYLKSSNVFGAVERSDWRFWSHQNFPIAFFYYHVSQLTGFDYDLASFVVNNLLILASYRCLTTTLTSAGLSTKYSFLFFLNPQLVYYSQAINKEIPTLFFVLLLTCLAAQRKWWTFGLMAILAVTVRQQLVLFAGFLFVLQTARRYWLAVLAVYAASALAAAVWAPLTATLVQAARFSKLVSDLNIGFYAGNLLLAPVIVVQWIYEQLRSLWFITPEGYINLYFLRDVIAIATLLWLLGTNLRYFARLRVSCKGPERIMISSILAYTFMQLVHPIIQQRYYFPIEVLLIALGSAIYAARARVSTSHVDDLGSMSVSSV